jgi:uncharacterized repeat protein (TIGR01451 family)
MRTTSLKYTSGAFKALILAGSFLLPLCSLISFAAAQTCISPPADLISWWPGDGDANDIQDSNHGTLQGGASFAPGMVGQAFSFDGSDDFVRVPTSSSLNPIGSFSIDAWIFPTQDTQGHIVSKWGDEGEWGNERAYSFHTLPLRALRFAISDDAHQLDSPFHEFDTPANVITLNVWNHVAAVYDQPSGTRRIYVNGALVAERTDPPITVTDSIADLTIGVELDSPTSFRGFFTGLIDEVEIYNRALSAAEIQAIFNAGSAGKCKPGAGADLGLTITDSPDPVTVSQPLTYTLAVTNNGPSPASGVTVTDTLPSTVTIGSASASQGSCSVSSPTVTCSLGSLANGASATVTITVTPSVTGTLPNTASVSGTPTDPNTSNNSATATTSVVTKKQAINLMVSIQGQGSVVSNPSGINCRAIACAATFPSGTTVSLTATPASGWKFSSWSGDCTGTANPCTVSMTQDRKVTATFVKAK